MSRRGQVLTVSTAAAVPVASVVALSVSTHASRWWLHRGELAHLASLDPQRVDGFPPAQAPRALDSIGRSAGFAVPFVGVVLIGAVLALVGRRWWAVGAVTGLGLSGAPDGFPLTGELLVPPDPSLVTLPAGWPWNEIALDVGRGLLPVLVAVLHPVELDVAAVLHAGVVVLVGLSPGVTASASR